MWTDRTVPLLLHLEPTFFGFRSSTMISICLFRPGCDRRSGGLAVSPLRVSKVAYHPEHCLACAIELYASARCACRSVAAQAAPTFRKLCALECAQDSLHAFAELFNIVSHRTGGNLMSCRMIAFLGTKDPSGRKLSIVMDSTRDLGDLVQNVFGSTTPSSSMCSTSGRNTPGIGHGHQRHANHTSCAPVGASGHVSVRR